MKAFQFSAKPTKMWPMFDFGYVAAEFNSKDVTLIRQLTSKICKPDDFYYSDKIKYIKGNVSADLHLTIFYGLISQKTDKNKINQFLKNIQIKALTLGKIRSAFRIYTSLNFGLPQNRF